MRLSWPSVPGSAASVSIGGNGAVEVLPPPLPAATASVRSGSVASCALPLRTSHQGRRGPGTTSEPGWRGTIE
ncbi:hypothetical protein G6F65_014517 [Rhizopus arrhizus]|nr:hypothetical protein G6F65_014517 [Rhizopus arrhizus]